MLQYKLAHFNLLRAFPLTQLKQVPRNHRGLALLARRGSLRLVYKRRSLCSRNKAGLAHLTNRRSLRSRNMLAPNMRAGVAPIPILTHPPHLPDLDIMRCYFVSDPDVCIYIYRRCTSMYIYIYYVYVYPTRVHYTY